MSVLFEKTKISSMELKNRLVRSATYESMADREGFPTEDLPKLYERLVKGGVGLIITGMAYVARDGKVDRMNGIDSDKHIPEYRKLTDLVHQNGSKIAMQINHTGRQTTRKAIGTQPMAPSAVKDKSSFTTPREMTEGDIERVIEAFATAAKRVKDSGFDAVQIHGAHGYLINQFLNPHTNRRKDKWGGVNRGQDAIFIRDLQALPKARGQRLPYPYQDERIRQNEEWDKNRRGYRNGKDDVRNGI